MNVRPAIGMSRDLAEALGLQPAHDAGPTEAGEFRFVIAPPAQDHLSFLFNLRRPLHYVWPIDRALIDEDE